MLTTARSLVVCLRASHVCVCVHSAAYLAIPFFEQPSWCYTHQHCGDPAAYPDVARMFSHVASRGATQAVESACIVVFAAEMGLKAYCMSPRAFFASPWHVMQATPLQRSTPR
jgi:hypothetical protein